MPGTRRAIDEDGLLYRVACGGWRVDPLRAELGPVSWRDDVLNWMSRARRGAGVVGRHDSATAYFWGEGSWGGPIAGSCGRRQQEPRGGREERGGGGGNERDRKPPKPEQTPPPPEGSPPPRQND